MRPGSLPVPYGGTPWGSVCIASRDQVTVSFCCHPAHLIELPLPSPSIHLARCVLCQTLASCYNLCDWFERCHGPGRDFIRFRLTIEAQPIRDFLHLPLRLHPHGNLRHRVRHVWPVELPVHFGVMRSLRPFLGAELDDIRHSRSHSHQVSPIVIQLSELQGSEVCDVYCIAVHWVSPPGLPCSVEIIVRHGSIGPPRSSKHFHFFLLYIYIAGWPLVEANVRHQRVHPLRTQHFVQQPLGLLTQSDWFTSVLYNFLRLP
mmetsp:Transcript_43891/g.138559  ORF Transcript_43891/g.138559 Transcript_43891/m.138559 type:complete len:260 (-) Transcript_43891:477-1256(-)